MLLVKPLFHHGFSSQDGMQVATPIVWFKEMPVGLHAESQGSAM